jgi:broad specificity phosphatase PhoE
VIASPLERAQETALPIAAAHSLDVRTDPRLTEASNVFEGAAGNLLWYILRHPKLWRALRSRREPSWGERHVDLAARVGEAITAARREFPGAAAVLVSHQAPIWVARLSLERRSLHHYPQQRRCALASVTTLTYEDDRLVAIDYAEPGAAALPGVDPGRAGA